MGRDMNHIFLVEKDKAMQRYLKKLLQQANYELCLIDDVIGKSSAIRTKTPQIILFDLDFFAVDYLVQLYRVYACPILALSCKNDSLLKIQTLDAGASDYILKPFSDGEFLARIRVGLRRNSMRESGLAPGAFQ